MTDDPLVICLLPSVFNPKSNGHFIYLEFCASLIGEVKNIVFISNDSRYAHGEIGRQSYDRYRERFAGLYITEQDFATLLTPDLTQKMWLVLPDHIEGLNSILAHFLRNDPHVIGCINIMLAPAYALAGNSKSSMAKEDYSYKQGRDYFAFYSRIYSYNICREELYIEPLPGDVTPIKQRNTNTSNPPRRRNLITFYIGKGVVSYSEQVLHVLQDLRSLDVGVKPELITRSWPASKREYNEVLKRSLCLITYDPITNVERDAASQGTPVLDVNPIMTKPWLPSADATGLLECIHAKRFDQIIQDYEDYSRACIKTNKINYLIFASVVASLINHGEVNEDYLLPYTPELETGFLSLRNKLQRYFADAQQAESQALLNVDEVISIATTPC
ncbi:hypothetical protein I1E95_14670 [Synechococcus sp. CBW1107]|nr:hypothetical protein I1E95_14670 [Synechococcus sp. CBW1107]